MYWMVPTHSLTARLLGGTWSRSASAGLTMIGSIRSSYESKAKPSAATTQISHCSGVSGAAGREVSICVIGSLSGEVFRQRRSSGTCPRRQSRDPHHQQRGDDRHRDDRQQTE